MAEKSQPEDAHRGVVNPFPADVDEAAADRELADAERAVVVGAASDEQRARVLSSGEARSQEERRERWMASAGSGSSDDPQ